MIVSYYDVATGQILYVASVNTPQQADATGLAWIEGEYHNDVYHVIDGQARPLPQRRQHPDLKYRYDHQQQQWTLDATLSSAILRGQRMTLLSEIDQFNAMRFAALTDQQKIDLQNYRQALLDVPQQPGFPTDIEWPTKPAWL